MSLSLVAMPWLFHATLIPQLAAFWDLSFVRSVFRFSEFGGGERGKERRESEIGVL